ncbi:MAG: hypothetical protein ABUT20_32335 [Bacteroidota bacterium]
MKNIETVPASINLHELISRLISSYQTLAENQKSFFINDVPTGLSLVADQEVLSTLLGSLFYIVARSSKNNSIHICATAYGDRVLISVSDSSPSGTYGVFYEFQHLRLLSQSLNGFLKIETYHNRETTITYNFQNRSPHCLKVVNELKIA